MLSTDNSIGCGNSVSTSSQIQTKIIGGQPSDIYDWPWVAALTNTTDGKNQGPPFCGGAVITKRHILTAAHCVTV